MKRWFVWVVAAALAGSDARAADPPHIVPGVRYIYLIRHGVYDRDDKADDRVGNGLNALGREQARLIGERLAKLPVRMTSLVSSDYTRARETADIMGRMLELTSGRDSLLHECTPPSERATIMDQHSAQELGSCEASLAAVWAKYMRPSPGADHHDVLVCHGNVIRWLTSRSLGVDTRHWSSMEIANASLTVILVRADSTTRLVMFNDVGHLPVDRQTWTGSGAGWGSPATR